MYNNRKVSRSAVRCVAGLEERCRRWRLTDALLCYLCLWIHVGSPGATDAPKKLLGMQNQIMKDQDQQLELIGQGVSNLRNYSLTVKDETELHVRLLSEIDDDVTRVTDGLETEGVRAARVRQSSVSTVFAHVCR